MYNCRTQHSTEQFRYFPSYPPDNHHSSDAVYWRRRSVIHVMHSLLPVHY